MPDNTIPKAEVKAPIKTLTLDDVLATPPTDELEKAQKQSEFLLTQKTSAPKIGTSVQGNFEEIQKLADQNVNFVTPSSTWKEQAATNQSTLEQLGNLTHQVVIGHGVGGTIAGLGYIGTLAQGAAEANKYDNAYTNSWVEFGNAILENSQQGHEILKKNPGEFDFGDPASYIQSAADMGSMLSMLIPTGAVVKGLGAVAKGITLSSRFAKAANSIGVGAKFANLATKGITSAIISRQIESSMEAYGKYNETYNKYKSLGLSEEQAKESAAKVAATTYRGNWAMLAQDIPQYLTMYSNLGGSVTKGLGSGFNKALQGAKAFALDSLGEGAEEGYQYLLGEYASQEEDIRSGLANADYGMSYRLKKNLKNDEFLSSVISGMFGSAIIQGGSKAIGAYQSKFTEAGREESALTEKYESDKIDLAKNYAFKFARINTAIKASEESGDTDATNYYKKELNTQLALKSSELGNIDKHIEFLEGLQNEDLEAYNTENGTEYTDDFKKFLPEMIADSKKIGSLVEEGARKYGPSLSTLYAEAKFNLENKDVKRRGLDGDIATTVSSLPLLSNFSAPGQIEASNKLLINSNNALLKNLNLLKDSDLTESKRKNVESTIKNIEEQNTKLEKQIEDAGLLERTPSEKKSDAELLKSIENLPNNLDNKISHRAILDLDVKNSLDTLNTLNKNPKKIVENQLLQKIENTHTIEGLETLSSSLSLEDYDLAKETLRTKLDSKYAELKQKEDDKKREELKTEILSTDKAGQGKTDAIVGEKQLTLDDILGTNSVEVTETTTAELDADVFKVDPLSDSEYTDLIFKQGRVVNSGTLTNGDAVSIELERYDLIVYGIYNNKVIEPKFVFTTGNREYAINNNGIWTIEGEIVPPVQLTEILDHINQDINTNSIYETQLFTPKQNDQILQSVIPNQSIISSELSEESVVGISTVSDLEAKKADIERRRQEELKYANFGNRQKEIQEGRENTKKIFDNLKQKYPANTLTGQVLRLLEKLIDINRISTISEKNHQSARGGKANGSAFEGGIILDSEIFDRVLNGEERAVKTFIHELFHQILNTSQFEAHKRGENTNLSSGQIKAWENLERLYEKAKNISNAKSEYGFTNLSEFLAEAFSNQGFQKELSNIKGEGKDTTLFKEILSSLLDFFKESLSKWAKRFNKPIPEINSGLLQDVMYWSEQLLDINKPYTPDLTTEEINAKYDAELAALNSTSESVIEQVAYTEDHNTEISAYYDEEVRENLTGTRLAYTNNEDTEKNKDLLDLLQSSIPFTDKIVDNFVLSIDTESEYLKPGQLENLDKSVGDIPIAVSFKGKDGKSYKSYLYTVRTLKGQGYNSEKQIDNLLALRQAVVTAYKQGSSVITQLDESNSVLGGKLVKENKLPYYGRVTDLLEVSAEEISLRTTTKNYYIKPDGKEDYDLGVPRLAGTVHAIIKDNNGKGIPIQLKNNNINTNVAKSIHAIYLAIAKSGRKTKISKEFKESFSDPITKGMLDILGTEATYNDLLSNLVYEGKRETENKNTPLFLSDNILTYGSTKVDIEKVDITDFLDYLQTNKYFQINRSLIGNTEYKELLFDNNILTTNLKANGGLFKQPVVSLSVEAAKPRRGIKVQEDPLPKKKEDESKPTTTRRGLSTIVKEFDSISVAPSVAEAINEQESIAWLKKNLSKVDVSIQDDVIEVFKDGTQSIGRFTEGMIKLSRLAQSGTEYHEAFHAVSQLYLKPKQRDIIYDKVRKVEGKELTDKQAEELLADEFEYYVKTNGTANYKYVKNINSEPLSFFGKLLQLIKSIFSDQVSVDKIFKNITSGYYSNKELPTDLQVTSYDKRVDNLSVEQTADITNFLTYTAFAAQDLTFSNISNLDFNKAGFDLLARYDNLDDSFRERYERVFDSLFRKDWRTVYNTVDVGQLSSVEWIDYNSTLFENLKDNLRTLGIETKITQVEREILEDEESKEENYSPLVTKASYNYSNKETSRNSTKLLVANLPALEGFKDGKPIYIKDEFFGLPKIADYASSWSFVEDLLSNIIPEETQDGLEIMMDRLSKSLVYKPELTKLYTNLTNANQDVRTQFYTDMNLVKNNFATTFITKVWNNDKKQYEYTWKFSKGNSKNIGDRIIQDWATTITNNFKSDTKIDQAKLIEQINKLSEIELKVKDNNTTEEKLKDIVSDLNKVLSDIGIKFNSINSFSYAVSAQPGKDLRSKLRSLLTSTDFGIDAVIERLVQGKDSVSKILNSEKGLLFLALQESKFRKDGFESSVTGAEGNKKWSYSYGSFFNKAVSAMKDPKSTLFTKLSNTSYFKNSVWARQVRTGEISASAIESSIFSSLKVEAVGDQGSSLTDLTKNEELSDIINRIIANIDNNKNRSLFSTGLAKADKSTDVLISGFKAIRSDYTGKELGKGALSILRGYIADELDRTRRAHQDVNNWKEAGNNSDLIEYYHYDPKTKDVFDKSGGAFRMFLFPSLSAKTLKESNKELYDSLYDESGVPFPITEKSFKNPLLDAYVNTEFRKILNFEIAQGLKVGVIKSSEEGLKNISLDKEVVKGRSDNESDAVVSLFADYLLNGIINNVETTKFLHGDPAMYKGGASNPFGDIKKRTPLILASGRQLRIFKDLEGNYVVRPKYTSAVVEDSTVASYTYTDDYIKQLAGIYSELDGVSYDEVYTRLTDQFGAYKKVDETDAQAYITLDRFRETQLGWGKWTDSQQEAYEAIKDWQENPTQDKLLIARKLSINSNLAMQSLKSVHTGLEFHDSNPDTAIVEYNKQSEAVLNPIFTAGLPLDRVRKAMEEQGVDHIIFRSGKKVGTQGPTTISTNGEIHTDIKFNKIKSLSNSNYYLQQDLPVHGFEESLEGSQIYKVVQTNVDLNHTYNNGQTGQELITELNSVQSQLSDIGISSLKSELGYSEKGWAEEALLKLRKKVSDALTKRGASENTRESLQDSSYPFSAIVQAAKRVSNNFNSMVNTAGVKLPMPGGPLIQISGFGIARLTDYTTLDNTTKGGIIWFGDKKLTPPQIVKDENGIKFIKGQILVSYNIVKDIPGWETMDRKQLIASIDTSILTAIGYRIPNQGPSSNDVLEIVGILPEEMGDSVVLYNEVTTKTGADFDIDKMYIMVPNYTYNKETKKLEKVVYDKENPTKEGLQNRKLELYETLLSDPSSYLSVVAPLDSTFIKDTVDSLHGEEQIEQQDLMFMSPGYQYQVKTSFRGGKTGIGVLANNIVDHTQAQVYNLKLNGIKYGRGNYTKQGETSLAGVYSEPTKDGKIYKISEVLSWYANAFVDIAKDPYITKGNINDITLSTTMLLTRAGFAPDWVIAFIGQPILKDYVNLMYSNEGRIKNFSDVFETLKQKYPGTGIADDSKLSTSKLEELIKNNDVASQASILQLFLKYDRTAKALQEQIRATKQDVNGAGKSNIESFTISELRAKVLKENKIGNVDAKFRGTSLETAYNNSVKLLDDMFGEFLFADNSVTKTIIKQISKNKGLQYATNLDLNEKASSEFYSYVASGLPFFAETNLKELLYGGNSLAKRVYSWKYNPASPLRDNILVQYLETIQEKDEPGVVGINQFRDKSIMVQDQISQAWEELLASDNANIKKTAEDLVRYAFYSSGFNPNAKAIFEYIPYKFMKQIGFGEYMDNFMKNPDESITDNFIDQFYQNNSEDESIVNTVRSLTSRKDGTYTIPEEELEKNVIGYSISNESTQTEYPRYVGKNKEIYKLQGYDSVNTPIYTKLLPKGTKTNSGYSIVEYSFESNKNSLFVTDTEIKKDSKIKLTNLSSPKNPTTEFIDTIAKEDELVFIDNTNPDKGVNVVTDTYQYYGKSYDILLDDNGVGISVLGYKGKLKDENKLLSNYNENKNVDPQNGKNFRKEITEEKKELGKYELFPGVFANEGQKEAIDSIEKFLKDNKERSFLLIGRGGTGKTTIIKKALLGKNVLYIAPTHKAKKVLSNATGEDAKTLQSALAIRLNESTGKFEPDTYARKNEIPIQKYPIIVIDESSMISDSLLEELYELTPLGTKIIFMGDSAQLPPVGQDTDSKVFETPNKYELLEKMRQSKGSPIIEVGTIVAENVLSDKPVQDIIKDSLRKNKKDSVSNSSIEWMNNKEEAISSFVRDFKEDPTNTNNVKIVTFNNENHTSSESVKNLNIAVRKELYGPDRKEFEIGEILTAYDTFKISEREELNNSDDFIIKSVTEDKKTSTVTVESKKGVRSFSYTYNIFNLELIDSEGVTIKHQIPVIANTSKEQFKTDLDNLFKTDIQLAYALKARFANLNYGYVITSHKAQGSTYKTTYVMEDNILGRTNGGNNKAKNQSLYVAVSRPTTKLVMISEKNTVSLDEPIKGINYSIDGINTLHLIGQLDKQILIESLSNFAKDKKVNLKFIEYKDKEGFTTYGQYNRATNTVNLNIAKVNANTLLHEIAHPFVTYLNSTNPKLFNKIYEESKKLYPEIASFLDNETYSKMPESWQQEEYIVRAIEKEFKNEDLKVRRSILNKFLDLIKEFFGIDNNIKIPEDATIKDLYQIILSNNVVKLDSKITDKIARRDLENIDKYFEEKIKEINEKLLTVKKELLDFKSNIKIGDVAIDNTAPEWIGPLEYEITEEIYSNQLFNIEKRIDDLETQIENIESSKEINQNKIRSNIDNYYSIESQINLENDKFCE